MKTVELKLDRDFSVDITRQDLILSLENLEQLCDPADLPIYNALVEVILYYSNKDQREDFLNRRVSPEFGELVFKEYLKACNQ